MNSDMGATFYKKKGVACYDNACFLSYNLDASWNICKICSKSVPLISL